MTGKLFIICIAILFTTQIAVSQDADPKAQDADSKAQDADSKAQDAVSKAQDAVSKGPDADAEPKEAAAQDFPMSASKEHELLKSGVGTWDAEISVFSGPDEEPVQSKGVEVVKMLGDLWAVSDFRYQFKGQPTLGHGVIGYDPALKKYVGSWFESVSAYRSNMEGTYDEATRKTTYKMVGRDASGAEFEYKAVTSQIDNNNKTFEMFMPKPDEPGQFIKMMDIKYTRRTAELN